MTVLDEATALMVRLIAERDEAQAEVERLREELGSDTHRDPSPIEEPKREYIVHATVQKRVRLELLAEDDQEALDDAAHAALYDDTLDVLDEQVTDTSIVWRGRDEDV